VEGGKADLKSAGSFHFDMTREADRRSRLKRRWPKKEKEGKRSPCENSDLGAVDKY